MKKTIIISVVVLMVSFYIYKIYFTNEFYSDEVIVKLKSENISCDFENRHLRIDSISSLDNFEEFENQIILPTFRNPNFEIARNRYLQFVKILDEDSLFTNVYYIRGRLSKRKHNLSMDLGCEGTHSLLVIEILDVRKK